MARRIALIHALAHSMAPIAAAFDRLWPGCRLMSLLDDSLSADLAASSTGLDEPMFRRFEALTDYAVSTGADGILFTCSAFGPCIEATKRRHPETPILKPNEAMIDEAASLGGRIGLIATFGPTLQSMPPEFPSSVVLETELAEGGLSALDAGDTAGHDAAAVAAARRLKARGATAIALAQFSLARAAGRIAADVGLPVLTTPDSAVRALKRRLEQR